MFEVLEAARASQIVQSFAGCKIDNEKKPLRLRASDVAGAIKLAQDILSKPCFFANAPRGVVFQGCFVEVRAVKKSFSTSTHPRIGQGSLTRSTSKRIPAPAKFLGFLQQVFGADPDAQAKVDLVQEYVGTAMLGLSTRYQRSITKLGPGSNGKGVLAFIIERSMPPGSCVAIAPQDFGNEYRAAMLAGKLLNIVTELPETEILDSESFKAVVAGDSLTGRHIRQAPFTFRPIAGHMFASKPIAGDRRSNPRLLATHHRARIQPSVCRVGARFQN